MRKKVFKTLVAVLALAAVTGPVRGQTVPDVEYNLRGIPQGWTATANGNNVTVTDGKTAPIDPASPVSLTPSAADIFIILPDLQQVNLYNGSTVATYGGYTLGKNGCDPVLPSEPYDPSITYNWCMG